MKPIPNLSVFRRPFHASIIIPFILLSIFQVSAQIDLTVSGTVLDEEGKPLQGVTVIKQGTVSGTVTDVNGKYSINAASNDVLVFSFIGFITQEVPVNNRTRLDVSLEMDLQTLGEVVISGYGITTLREEVTYAVSRIDEESLKKTAPVSFTELLQGRAAGVSAISTDGAPGAGMSINIRGASSLSGGNTPLIVIDNIPYEPTDDDAVNPLAFINPNDVESINILKDASATALYGVGASNGVIVITTKRGKLGKPSINARVQYGIGEFARTLPTSSPQQYALHRALRHRGDNDGDYIVSPGAPGMWELVANPEDAAQYLEGQSPFDILENEYGLTNFEGTDWLDVITQNTTKQIYNLDFSGATENTNYYASYGYTFEDGAIINSSFDRVSGLLNLEQKLGNVVTAGLKLNYARSEYDGLLGDRRAQNAIAQINSLNPFINRDNVRGDREGLINNGGSGAGPESPEFRVNNTHSFRANDYFAGNANLAIKPLDWLELSVTGGLIVENFEREQFFPSALRFGAGTNGLARIQERRESRWVVQPRISMNNSFSGGHKVGATLVFEAKKQTRDQLITTYQQFDTEVLDEFTLAAAQSVVPDPSFEDIRAASFLTAVNYSFKGRYVLNASIRVDGSSRFINDKTGIFPAVSLAWNLGDERFMDFTGNFLSTLKLRAGVGVTGNDQINPLSGLSVAGISTVKYPFNDSPSTAIDPQPSQGVNNPRSIFGNPDATWETTTGINLGIDLGFLQEKFFLSANYYNNKTTDLLLSIQLPDYSGFNSSVQNLGEMRNQGVELEAITVNIDKADFTWRTNFNIAFNKNEILDLGGNPELGFKIIGTRGISANDVILRIGEPIGTYYGTIQGGVINNLTEKANDPRKNVGANDQQPGNVNFMDVSGNGVFDRNEYLPIAQALPLHTGGIGNNFTYKGFDLYAFLRWSFGNDVINDNINRARYLRGDQNPDSDILDDIWTRQNTNRNYHSVTGILTQRTNALFNRSEMVEDGSYLRLETVTLGYNLPGRMLGNLGLSRARVYFTGQNLAILTRYSWYDPEVNAAIGPNKALFPGLDRGSYPRARTFLFGLDLSF